MGATEIDQASKLETGALWVRTGRWYIDLSASGPLSLSRSRAFCLKRFFYSSETGDKNLLREKVLRWRKVE